MVEKMRQGAKEVAPRLGDSLTLSANNGKILEVASRPSAPQTVTPRPIALKPRGLTKTHKRRSRPAFDCIALLLQGGGALGAYQAGVYEALAEANLHPDWTAGISIGAINSALIAGNPPESRVEKLREFWQQITTPLPLLKHASQAAMVAEPTAGPDAWQGTYAAKMWEFWERVGSAAVSSGLHGLELQTVKGDAARGLFNKLSAGRVLMTGAAGFFTPRLPVPWLCPGGSLGATSYYDTGALRTTLERLIDFDRIDAAEMRLSMGAVNVTTGNLVYFDNTSHAIRPEHVMASGALPPGFPAVEIDGERYWDGGLISNTPLQWVLDNTPRQDTLAFQVDLWSARGDFPGNMAEVETRQKEIQYSSRTRANTDQFKRAQRIRNTVAALIESLPDGLKDEPSAKLLGSIADRKVYNMVHLIYRAKNYEGNSKDYEFSRSSMETHWRAGYHDTVRTLRHPDVLKRPTNHEGVAVFDLEQDGRD